MKNIFEQLESNPSFGKMFVFMDNVQYTAVNDKEIELITPCIKLSICLILCCHLNIVKNFYRNFRLFSL